MVYFSKKFAFLRRQLASPVTDYIFHLLTALSYTNGNLFIYSKLCLKEKSRSNGYLITPYLLFLEYTCEHLRSLKLC